MARRSIDCRDYPDDTGCTQPETNRAVVAAREVEP